MLMRARLPTHDELAEIYAPEYFKASAEDPADGYADYLGDAERHEKRRYHDSPLPDLHRAFPPFAPAAVSPRGQTRTAGGDT